MTAKLNFRSALFLLLPVLFLTFSCKDMKLDIQDLKDRLEVLEGTTITSINEQISAINTSISDLKEVDESLDAYIKALEATATDLQKQIDDANAEIAKVEAELGEEISVLEQTLLNELNTAKEAIEAELLAINNTLAELKQADEALDKKISGLQAYVDTQLTSTTNWANATFSTLTQYEQTQTEISAIKASIEQINAGMSALETRLNGKIVSDIQTAIDALRIEVNADHASRIESSVNNLTVAYTAAISSARTEITTAYTNAISNAIIASESGMKAWVNSVLTQGYYDIATIDGKLSALSARLDETDADLQKQIAELKTALETSKEELTKAYKSVIKEAIEENNGVINASIAEAVQNLEDKIQARLTVIETNISNIQKQIANISKDINSIYEQIAEITSSLSDLQDVDREFDGYVKSLEEELAVLRAELEANSDADAEEKKETERQIANLTALISALQQRDSKLHEEIENLESYVNMELEKTTDWAEATFATLEQYSAMQAEISAIKTLIDKTKADITEEYTAAIETAISNSETSMKAWVNTLLAQGYYTISDIDGKVSALEALISDGDTNLQNQINEQKTALQLAKADLTNEYKQYINQAIASGGIIDQAIATQVKKAQDELQSKIDAINERLDSLEDRLGKLEEDFVNRIQSLKYIPEYSNHVAYVSDVTKTFSVDFFVTPIAQANKLSAEWGKDNTVLRAYVCYTKTPVTKATVHATPLLVSSVSASEEGLLSVILREDNSSPLSKEFWAGEASAVMYLYVSDGNTELISDLVDLKMFDDEFDLSSSQTANCYIVSEAGDYKFTPTKGNSDERVGEIASVEVLWETFGTDVTPSIGALVKNVKYEGSVISFETPSTFTEGNAVIAAKDANGIILWSWHIWFTDQPQGQEYYNNAGTMMDRNLGATSATPGDVGALGLLYQWGRKDPFLGSSSISSSTLAKSTIVWPFAVSSDPSIGTIGYATANPTTFIKGNSKNYDWYYTGSSSTDNTRWTTSDKAKSIYDPCPAGWRVPDGGSNGVWSNATGSSSIFSHTYSSSNEGMNFSGKFGSASTIWYPASGYRYGSDGGLDIVGDSGSYWSASPNKYYAYYLFFNDYGYVRPSESLNRADGRSVRCQKE